MAILGLAGVPPGARTGDALNAGAEIRGIQLENGAHDLFVSFGLSGAFTREIRDQIDSGLPVTFNHFVEILNRRPAWFDATVVRKVISSTVTFDTLTRQYRLNRSVNGEMMETLVSDRQADMERFMTSVDRLRLCDPADLAGDRALYLRVKSRVQKRFVFFFIPWDFETSWARVRLNVADTPASPSP
ncbi:MAG: DUF4390 domain-containing protein [Acidobacteria bacterium]|nr:DUF4390 domain-containing protein [Acidobacteriota bacterium]